MELDYNVDPTANQDIEPIDNNQEIEENNKESNQTEVQDQSSSQVTQEPDLNQLLNVSDEDIESKSVQELLAATPSQQETGVQNPSPEENLPESSTEQSTDTVASENTGSEEVEDYKSKWERITSEFRANGTTMKLSNPDDIIRAMQMGMNYQKKMRSLKPHLNLIKTLEQAGALEESKIKFVVDLLNHDKTAIAKLIQDSGVDTYDLPDITETGYTSKTNVVSNEELAFQEKIAELQETQSGLKILSDLQNWDDKSVSEVYADPHLLDLLASHQASGLYKDTMEIVTRDAALGKIPETMSNLDAYDYVATNLLNANPDKYKMSGVAPTQSTQPKIVGNNLAKQSQAKPVNKVPATASIPQGNRAEPNLMGVPDILNMSDEEFDKYSSFQQLAKNLNFKG